MDFWKIVQRKILFVFVNLFSTRKVPHGFFWEGSSLCPMPVITGHVAIQTRVQD